MDASTPSLLLYPKEKEAWIASMGKNIGREQNGSGESFSRPVLVVKKFNNEKASVVVAQLRLLSIKRFMRPMYVFRHTDFESVCCLIKSFIP